MKQVIKFKDLLTGDIFKTNAEIYIRILDNETKWEAICLRTNKHNDSTVGFPSGWNPEAEVILLKRQEQSK